MSACVLKENDGDEGKAFYSFEITNNAFKVDGNGLLAVNDAHLDRDAPNPSVYKIQVMIVSILIIENI